MHKETAARLSALNRQFYQTFALQFSATRQRLQPGVQKVLESLPADASLLDLGCGNGELARELDRRGHAGAYVGLDYSHELLEEARGVGMGNLRAEFLQADITSADWPGLVSLPRFDFVFAFAVLHHLPGNDLRSRVLRQMRQLLSPEGSFVLSVWQFLNSARLRNRIQPWDMADITEQMVEPGDYLLDWRSGGQGLRYVHSFTEEELSNLAVSSGFRVVESFHSDGEGGKLGLYQFWLPEPAGRL